MNLENFKKLDASHLIAEKPLKKRDTSKLLVLNRETSKVEHKVFANITDYLEKKDCLVLNNSKVFPARLIGKKTSGGNAELLLVRQIDKNRWLCLSPKCKMGVEFFFGNSLKAKAIGRTEDKYWLFEFSSDNVLSYALKHGVMPLPPYIEKSRKKSQISVYDEKDKTNYQTVYAKAQGSIAAPTAGFHFTGNLLDNIKKKGVKTAFVTLHVGWGTFKPLKTEPEKHTMHSEYAEITKENADIINKTKKNGGRVFCVGTTTVRTLESFASKNGIISCGSKQTDLFIYPPYEFKAVNCLITNFHQPDSTLICMTAAFAGERRLLKAYKEAIEKKYRFYSYGDAMIII